MSVRRVLHIIDFVASRNQPVGVGDACRQLKLPQATVYRLFGMLESEGVLQRICDRRKYELSGRFLRTIITGASTDQIVAGFRDQMISLSDDTLATAFLGRLSGKLVETIHAVTPTDKTIPHIHPGLNVRPVHACSAARAILAHLQDDEVDELLGSQNTSFTGKTLTSKGSVLNELRVTKERGFAVCDEEIDVGVTSIAVPAFLGRAGVLCSVGVVAATSHMHKLGLQTTAEKITEHVENAISGFDNRIVAEPIAAEGT